MFGASCPDMSKAGVNMFFVVYSAAYSTGRERILERQAGSRNEDIGN